MYYNNNNDDDNNNNIVAHARVPEVVAARLGTERLRTAYGHGVFEGA